MKLRHLKIENFRGITCLELELADTNVLIGENNTGKSAILDALRFVQIPDDPGHGFHVIPAGDSI